MVSFDKIDCIALTYEIKLSDAGEVFCDVYVFETMKKYLLHQITMYRFENDYSNHIGSWTLRGATREVISNRTLLEKEVVRFALGAVENQTRMQWELREIPVMVFDVQEHELEKLNRFFHGDRRYRA
jgi:hypothetical protein